MSKVHDTQGGVFILSAPRWNEDASRFARKGRFQIRTLIVNHCLSGYRAIRFGDVLSTGGNEWNDDRLTRSAFRRVTSATTPHIGECNPMSSTEPIGASRMTTAAVEVTELVGDTPLWGVPDA